MTWRDFTYNLVLGAVLGVYLCLVGYWLAEWWTTRTHRRRDALRRFLVVSARGRP